MNAYGADPRLMANVPEAMRGTPMQGIPQVSRGSAAPAPTSYGPAPQAAMPPTMIPQLNARPPAPTQYGGNPNASPNPPPGSPGMPTNVRQAQQSQQPQPGYPAGDIMHTPYGPNGFGVHPELTRSEMVDYLLGKVKSVESSGDPTNYIGKADHLPYDPNPKGRGTASGYFGYTHGTWGNYKGYPRAMDAPPEIQEEKFRKDMGDSLVRFGGDPFKSTANHFFPGKAHDPSAWDDEIPNSGTVNGYLSKVFNAGSDKAGGQHARYIQGANPNRSSNYDKSTAQLP
jgi:hypothetical protein